MKIPAAFLILGIVLIAVLPVAADGIPQPRVGKEFSGILFTDRFDGDKTFNVGNSRSFLIENYFFSALRDDKFLREGVIDRNIGARGSSVFPIWKGWSTEERGRDWSSGGKSDDLGTTPVPEPGSFSFLLLGLAVVGFFGSRRVAWSRTT